MHVNFLKTLFGLWFNAKIWFKVILTMVDFNLTIKDHIHGLVIKLWSNNEQDINTLGVLWILIMHLMFTPDLNIST
jgi:hypothetical protein